MMSMMQAGLYAGMLATGLSIMGCQRGTSGNSEAEVATEVAVEVAVVEDEAAFRARCREQVLQTYPSATAWVDDRCSTMWQGANAVTPLAKAFVAFSPKTGEMPPSIEDMRAHLTAVQWSSDTVGTLDDLTIQLLDSGRITFYWQEIGAISPYNIIEALRMHGVHLQTLGCPQYPGASLGQEKVLSAQPAGRQPFTLTVYNRPAPTGLEPGVYTVDAAFSTSQPDMAALRAGNYPGGGGRAFAGTPTGWIEECPDPE